ncbi:MAG: hypothetical protein GKR94_20730 [Gammaproteobacteria bacterium]|nr:hypothetical protein [Gammaproteobacteria bacterium]
MTRITRQEIFREKRYQALLDRGTRPFVILNATDINFGSQFTFTQDQFDLLCSNTSPMLLNARHALAAIKEPILKARVHRTE